VQNTGCLKVILERGIVLLYMTRKLNNSHFFTGNELWMARF
jgi:hypothetical protein